MDAIRLDTATGGDDDHECAERCRHEAEAMFHDCVEAGRDREQCGAEARASFEECVSDFCVDGPDFDGHQVDWDLLMARQRIYLDEEKRSFEQCQARHGTKS